MHAGRSGAAAHGAAACIGPNAIIRTMEALQEDAGPERLAALLRQAGLEAYLVAPPQRMVPASEVARLHQVLHQQLGSQRAAAVLRCAGERTGAYVLAHRIPALARFVLRRLPPRMAGRMLVLAIRRHAWTFAGSAAFHATGMRPVVFTLTGCPLCLGAIGTLPRCDFYAGCFETLFRALVHDQASATETSCAATGADACRFELRW